MIQSLPQAKPNFVATRNACKMCTPLGACLAFSGIKDCVPFLHGSQGCSTYIRRYLISHFREPMDIASSNFGEHAAIFGGQENLTAGLSNVIESYKPELVGIATTCLSETIGDDMPMLLHEFTSGREDTDSLPQLVHASTPSYTGSHFDGYIEAVRSVVSTIVSSVDKEKTTTSIAVNLLPGIISPADIRHLRQIVLSFGLEPIILPDYSDRLDGPSWSDYCRIPEGGTSIDEIKAMGDASNSIELGTLATQSQTAGAWLKDVKNVSLDSMGLPIGVRASDRLFSALEQVSGITKPKSHDDERGRLIDSYIDGHKYIFGKRALVFGEEDWVAAIVGWLLEIGIKPVLCASGGNSGRLKSIIEQHVNEAKSGTTSIASLPAIHEGVDFEEMGELIESLPDEDAPDLMIGHSKGYKLSREKNIPLLRVGMPIHDRLGASRLLHLGYRGTQRLFDEIVNTLLAQKQDESEMGFTYL